MREDTGALIAVDMTALSGRHVEGTRMYLWRIAAESSFCPAHDLSGRDVLEQGGRWNRPGTPLVYACTSIAMAYLETLAHLRPPDRPTNRYLVCISVPPDVWLMRTRFAPRPGWDALPPGPPSQSWGMQWVKEATSLLACVPSVIVPEESNVLLNPRHPDAPHVLACTRRRWLGDPRLLPRDGHGDCLDRTRAV